MTAIELSGVFKTFRKVSVKGNYGTLKGALVSLVTGKGGKSPKPADDNHFDALRDISFSVPAGSTWGLIGRNGSGKSTLLKLVAGIYRPDQGHVKTSGVVSALIELGAGFHPEFSGRENIFINASILGLPRKKIQEKFDDIVSFAELWDFIDNPVRTYSSGMFMRLGFSVAVHADPDILLVDEVLAVGDEAFGHKCQEKMESFKKSGKTILLVTHNLDEVKRWCDGAVWIDSGAVKMIGKPNRVVDAYLATVAEKENLDALEKDHAPHAEIVETANRWGSGEVEITGVRLTDGAKEERRVFPSGEALTVSVDYRAHRKVAEPVFGIGINRKDGANCYGTNTHIEGIDIDFVDGQGSVAFTVDRLDLVDGAYTLSVAVHAKDGHAYDYHDQMYDFTVRSKFKDVGVFRPPHSWVINGQRYLPSEEAAR
ncbi:MAG: ABC transporter ATP-binding protein [Nitrospinae bacterium]|nr:ABC transporter ATP-binding protein [Nitrospinota bacterium]